MIITITLHILVLKSLKYYTKLENIKSTSLKYFKLNKDRDLSVSMVFIFNLD